MRKPAMSARTVGRPRLGSEGSILALVLLFAFALSACAEEEPAEFTDDTKSGFMAACSDLVEDSRFVGEICDCVFERTEDEFDFTRFATIDQQLAENPDRPLSTEVISIVAECVIETTEL